MVVKICPKCGEERPARGFNFHVKFCKGPQIEEEPQVEKLPSLEIISEPVGEIVLDKIQEIEKSEEKTEEILKDVPGIFIQSAIQSSLNKEREIEKASHAETRHSDESIAGECTCEGFEGESLFCPIHAPVVRCPGCKCVKSETKLNYMDPLQEYRCSICGLAYKRHTGTGEYSYE